MMKLCVSVTNFPYSGLHAENRHFESKVDDKYAKFDCILDSNAS